MEKSIESVGKDIIQNGASPVLEGVSEVSAEAVIAMPSLINNSSTGHAVDRTVDEAVLSVPAVLSPDDIEESPGRKKLRTVFKLFNSSLSNIYANTLVHNSPHLPL